MLCVLLGTPTLTIVGSLQITCTVHYKSWVKFRSCALFWIISRSFWISFYGFSISCIFPDSKITTNIRNLYTHMHDKLLILRVYRAMLKLKSNNNSISKLSGCIIPDSLLILYTCLCIFGIFPGSTYFFRYTNFLPLPFTSHFGRCFGRLVGLFFR